MNKTQIMQGIKAKIMEDRKCGSTEAVNIIAKAVSRDIKSAYNWLDIKRPDIPNQLLELLKLKL